MSAEYRGMGVAFLFPENWQLDQEPSFGNGRGVTVYSPEGGFWSLSIYPRETDPEQLASTAAAAIDQEYGDAEIETITETIAQRELIGRDVDFFYLDLPIRATIRCVRADHAVLVIFTQMEDREFSLHGEVFRAMTASLLDRLPNLRADLGSLFPQGGLYVNDSAVPSDIAADTESPRQFHETPLDAPPPEEIDPSSWTDIPRE
ncbi:MAG: hypothetical protein PHE53_04385 [Thermoguttaceae bacterium]|nr:hypothetical protein [Thermoguttaceae bacterium]